MTRTEFMENIVDFIDLRSFCWENDIDDEDVGNLVYRDDLSDAIWDGISDYYGSWTDLRDDLYSIDTGYDWYLTEGTLQFSPMDDIDFDRMRERIADELEDDGFFDEENEEDEEEQEPGDVHFDTVVVEDEDLFEKIDLDELGSISEYAAQAVESIREPEPEPEPEEQKPGPEPEELEILDLDELLF